MLGAWPHTSLADTALRALSTREVWATRWHFFMAECLKIPYLCKKFRRITNGPRDLAGTFQFSEASIMMSRLWMGEDDQIAHAQHMQAADRWNISMNFKAYDCLPLKLTGIYAINHCQFMDSPFIMQAASLGVLPIVSMREMVWQSDDYAPGGYSLATCNLERASHLACIGMWDAMTDTFLPLPGCVGVGIGPVQEEMYRYMPTSGFSPFFTDLSAARSKRAATSDAITPSPQKRQRTGAGAKQAHGDGGYDESKEA